MYPSGRPPTPPRRDGLIALMVLSSLALVAVAVCGILVVRNLADPSPTDRAASGTPGIPGATSTPAPSKKSYREVPDTGGPARGQAEAFSTLLRARGLVCSDENLAKVFSRGCYWKDFDHKVRVEFLGPVDGRLSEVTIDLDYIGAEDEATAHRAFDDLVGDFVKAAEMSDADAAAVRKELAAEEAEFSTDWGSAKLYRYTESTSTITFKRSGWHSPDLVAATLPGDLDLVESVAVQRGFRCERDSEYRIECQQGADDELKIVASGAVPRGLSRLYVGANTGRDDQAMEAALAEIGAVLDALGGSRAAAAKDWFTQNRSVAGGMAYVDGLHAYLDVIDDDRLHYVQFDLLSPCRYNSANGGFC